MLKTLFVLALGFVLTYAPEIASAATPWLDAP